MDVVTCLYTRDKAFNVMDVFQPQIDFSFSSIKTIRQIEQKDKRMKNRSIHFHSKINKDIFQ